MKLVINILLTIGLFLLRTDENAWAYTPLIYVGFFFIGTNVQELATPKNLDNL